MRVALRYGRGLLPLAITVVLAASAGAQTADPVGFVAGVDGTVDLRGGAAASWTAAAVDQELHLGDTVRTGPGSALKVLLVDDTVLSIGEETEIAIDSFVVGAAATQERSILSLLQGQVRVQVGEAFGGTTRLEVHTPTAVIGVKGTIFEAIVAQLLLTVCNWEGDVFVETKAAKARRDFQQGLCVEGWEDLSEPFPIPPDFQSVGAGPSAASALSSSTVGSLVRATSGDVGAGLGEGLFDLADLDIGQQDDIIEQEEARELANEIRLAREPDREPDRERASEPSSGGGSSGGGLGSDPTGSGGGLGSDPTGSGP